MRISIDGCFDAGRNRYESVGSKGRITNSLQSTGERRVMDGDCDYITSRFCAADGYVFDAVFENAKVDSFCCTHTGGGTICGDIWRHGPDINECVGAVSIGDDAETLQI